MTDEQDRRLKAFEPIGPHIVAEIRSWDGFRLRGDKVELDPIYIDPPTIPAGMTVETYRKVRALQRSRKVRGIRRIDARKMVV